MTDPTLPLRLREVARWRRLYAIERPDGREDLVESTVDVPATTADLRPVVTVDPAALEGLERVATHTAGVFLMVHADDQADEVVRVAAAALHAVRPETPPEPVEPRPDPDPVGALAAAHLADLRERIAQLDHTVALLPASRRRAAARAAVDEISEALDRAERALGLDEVDL